MVKKIIDKEAEELAKRLHKEEHLIIDGKVDKKHRLKDWFYLMASGLYGKLKSDNIETWNLIVDLQKEIRDLANSMKEISKQQKYLWQTLNEVHDLKGVKNGKSLQS